MRKSTVDFDVDCFMDDIRDEIMDIVAEELDDEQENLMFQKLPSNSERLLNEILESDDSVPMLNERLTRYREQDKKAEDELWGILRELEELHYIDIFRADNLLLTVTINNSARTYHEQLEAHNQMQTNSVQITNYNFNVADSSALHSIISQIRSIAEKVENNEELLKAIDELDKSIGHPTWSAKYNSFISSLASHATILSGIMPLVGKLSTILIK